MIRALQSVLLVMLISRCTVAIDTSPDGPPGPCVGESLGEWRVVRVQPGIGLQSARGTYPVRWPRGFNAEERDGRINLLNPRREVVAIEGETIVVGGSLGPNRM